jgi:hypothetical protein
MNDRIEEFKYLWQAPSDWALLYINSQRKQEKPRHIVINTKTNEVLLICDDILYENVKAMMIENGIKTIDSIPQE